MREFLNADILLELQSWPRMETFSSECILENRLLFGLNSLSQGDGTGVVADYWRAVISKMGQQYGKSISITWDFTPPTSNDVYDRIISGQLDSLCGVIGLGAAFRGVARTQVPPSSLSSLS